MDRKRIGVGVLMAALLGGIGTGKQVDRFADWVYEETSDPMTDAVSYTGRLQSLEISPERASIVIGCTELKSPLRILVTFDQYLGGAGDTRDFTYRAGSWTAVTEQWRYVGGSTVGIELPTDENSQLRQALNTSGKFNVRATTASGAEVDATFKILGASGLIARLLIDCKLDPRFP